MFHLTPTLKKIIEDYKLILNQEEHDSFVKEVMSRLEFYLEHFFTFEPGSERGREIQRLIDNEVTQVNHIKASCHKGCGSCCHLEVQITADDASVLIDSLMDGYRIDLERLRKLSLREKNDPAWKERVNSHNRCVFLDASQSCGIYDYRPAVCRKLLVTSPVEDCSKEDGMPSPIIMPIAEIVMSAAVTINGSEFDSLPRMLQKSIDQRALSFQSTSDLSDYSDLQLRQPMQEKDLS